MEREIVVLGGLVEKWSYISSYEESNNLIEEVCAELITDNTYNMFFDTRRYIPSFGIVNKEYIQKFIIDTFSKYVPRESVENVVATIPEHRYTIIENFNTPILTPNVRLNIITIMDYVKESLGIPNLPWSRELVSKEAIARKDAFIDEIAERREELEPKLLDVQNKYIRLCNEFLAEFDAGYDNLEEMYILIPRFNKKRDELLVLLN